MMFRNLEQKIVQIINESGMSIDAVYYVMKSIMAEIEQKYFEFCRMEDAEAVQKALELDQANEEPVVANNNEEQEEGAN